MGDVASFMEARLRLRPDSPLGSGERDPRTNYLYDLGRRMLVSYLENEGQVNPAIAREITLLEPSDVDAVMGGVSLLDQDPAVASSIINEVRNLEEGRQ